MKFKNAIYKLREQLAAEREAAKKLCEIYFNIAAEAVGEDEVRRKRDAAITERDKVRPAIFDPENYPEDRITELEQQLAAEHGRAENWKHNSERYEAELAAEREQGVKALAERSFELHECQKQLAAEKEKYQNVSKTAP